MRILYSIGIALYSLGVCVAALFNTKARQMRAGWRKSVQLIRTTGSFGDSQQVAWFHASSLGEFEQTRPVLEAYKLRNPDHLIVLTFFSPSGYEVRHNYDKADAVLYLPPDMPRLARLFVKHFNPKVAYFCKYDFWFNYLNQLRRRGTPTYIFSAIFRPSQYFFKWYGGWFRKQIGSCYTHLFVQNNQSLWLLQSHGIQHCTVAGDTRFDRVSDIARVARRSDVVEAFLASTIEKPMVLMAGSSWEPDEQMLKRYLDAHRDWLQQSNLRLVLAPHVIAESHLSAIEKLFSGYNCIRYSAMEAVVKGQNASLGQLPEILIIDNIGMLSTLYRYATVAYIGGGWGKGIHNTLEAITFGKPVVFGPNYHKFQEASDIIQLGGGFSYQRFEELERVVTSLFSNVAQYQSASLACTTYMQSNLGSTAKILSGSGS
ncbi:MAG: 3-deoxy-D-manno-octulosonic acid transferase [Bacteroidales bacterium]|nr:3-deoxy-D-manno-octulosonic acid transferase [Candidatus Colimorpha onthohippi]